MSLNPFGKVRDRLEHDWRAIARPEQLPPGGDWSIWLVLAGRGWGKTLTGAQWIRGLAEAGVAPKLALIAPTAADARDVMVQTLLEIAPNGFRPLWEPSKRSLTYPNGVSALAFSSEEPERLRGPQFFSAWLDELCAWKNVGQTFDMLQFTMRLGRRPRQVITTTPKAIPLLQALLKRDDIVVTRGRTSDNAANLAPTFIDGLTSRYRGTRLGRQELDAEILLDVEGALWTHDMIDQARAPRIVPPLERVIVGVDPSGAGSANDSGDMIGIVAVGKGSDGRAYVLADWSLKGSPDIWGRRAVQAYHHFNADRIVAERNFGGAMVEHVLRTVDRNVAYREVTASRGKVQRSEPAAALYEQGRVSHVGDMTELERQMCSMTFSGYQGAGSPDRVDALVWALSELMVSAQRPSLVFSAIAPPGELEVARRHLLRGYASF